MPEATPGAPAALRGHRAANPLKWTPRHFGDELKERHQARKKEKEEKEKAAGAHGAGPHADASEPEEPAPLGNERVRCACGRVVPAFALVDVRPLDPAVRRGQEWACDGCWTAWIRAEKLTRHDWLRGLGAPPALLERHEAHGHPFQP